MILSIAGKGNQPALSKPDVAERHTLYRSAELTAEALKIKDIGFCPIFLASACGRVKSLQELDEQQSTQTKFGAIQLGWGAPKVNAPA